MQRAYRDDMQSPRYDSNRLPKAGFSRDKQTYRCGECRQRFTPEGNLSYYPEAITPSDRHVHRRHGMGYSAISRVLGVKPETVYS